MPYPPVNLSDEEIQRRAALLIAFTHMNKHDAPMPEQSVEKRPLIVQGLEEEGLLEYRDGCYWITEAGISVWWRIVDDYNQSHSGLRTPDVVKDYNADGSRK